MFKKKPSSSHYLYAASALVVVGLLIFATNNQVKTNIPSVYDDFAQCLTDSGATMYGAWWCSHCNAQKDDFGSSFQYLNYVECSTVSRTMKDECVQEGIEGYPTWKFSDGTEIAGGYPLEVLAEKTGCNLPIEE